MPRNAQVFDVLIASPSDVAAARDAVELVILRWNAVHSRSKGTVMLPVRWETHAFPAVGTRSQETLNHQIVEKCDIVVAIFGTRLGGRDDAASSGTVEEIEECRKAGMQVLIYFSNAPIPRDADTMERVQRLEEYRREMKQHDLVWGYDSVEQLSGLAMQHLSAVMNGISPNAAPTLIPLSATSNLSAQRIAVARGLRTRAISIEAQWEADRDSQHAQTDDGKRWLSNLSDALGQIIASPVVQADADLVTRIKENLLFAKNIREKTIYADGGASYHAFWHDGDELFKNVKEICDTIEGI